MNRTKIAELTQEAKELGLNLTTYSPGDGCTRYRFSYDEGDYFEVIDIATVLGKAECEIWLLGYRHGKDN